MGDRVTQKKKALEIRKLRSPNCDERRDGLKPVYLILHYTGTVTGKEAEEHYMNPAPNHPGGPVSPHYMVDVDGKTTQFVAEDMSAWQAGKSRFDGLEDFNSRSIGIEIVNAGHDGGLPPFEDDQMIALIELCQGIMARNGIPAKNVLGHSDIAPERKKDPGERLDWAMLAQHGIGVWPKLEDADYEASKAWLGDDKLLRHAFKEAGYDDRVALPVLVREFQRHFQPEVFGNDEMVGKADAETAARLHSLQQLRR